MGDGRTDSSANKMNIMKLLTDNTVSPVMESNAAFSCQISPRSPAAQPAAPFVLTRADVRNAAARRERSKARGGVAAFGLAVFAVISVAAVWGWAILHLSGLLLQIEALLLRNLLRLS
jgi:hypothetical protein